MWLGGCAYITDDELADRLDVDNDGWPRSTDCDDRDPKVSLIFWYVDADRDGFGDDNAPLEMSCTQKEGLSARGGDCDDARPLAYPGAVEICNRLDDDCDGGADEGVPDAPTWYHDKDLDTFGDAGDFAQTCFPPVDYVANDLDCDDNDPEVLSSRPWYIDEDGDGWGDFRLPVLACEQPSGTSALPGDCDETDANINPGSREVCDTYGNIDEDCDGAFDDYDPNVDVSTGVYLWQDNDGDGLGDALLMEQHCHLESTPNFADNRDDCDDTDASVGTAPCPVLRVGTGAAATCAVRGDHRLACWGDDNISRNLPTGTFVDVSVGSEHACALTSDGTLTCWGNTGRNLYETDEFLETVDVDASNTCSTDTLGELTCWTSGVVFQLGVIGQTFEDLAVGASHACGLLDDGSVRCTGACDSGECAVPGVDLLDISAGREFSCGLSLVGTVSCWGDHPGATPPGLFHTIGSYGRNSCAEGASGSLTCWTANVGDTALLPAAGPFTHWDVGAEHGCGVLSSDGTVVCWGDDTFGQSTPVGL